jgi:hypothetical protein
MQFTAPPQRFSLPFSSSKIRSPFLNLPHILLQLKPSQLIYPRLQVIANQSSTYYHHMVTLKVQFLLE